MQWIVTAGNGETILDWVVTWEGRSEKITFDMRDT